MKRILVPSIIFLFGLITSVAKAQDEPLNILNVKQQKGGKRIPRCLTMELMEKAIEKDPSLPEKWRIEGEKRYNQFLERAQKEGARAQQTAANPIIIPLVFHLVDDAATIASISDRDILEQVEILNKDYAGNKMTQYLNVIPPEIAARVGNIPVKFVLARRDPNGAPTTGIERRANTTPDHVSIKYFSSGGLDAWDSSRYVNIWCGTFTGSDAGLLGISTFPFTTDEGPQGCVVSIITLPYAGNTSRIYEPLYSEGSTITHEIGHYFYLWHTFGDQDFCNNNDFRIQAGWPLPAGAGPEGDDTPKSKGTGSDNFVYGNPSMNYSDGCASESFGMMYGSFMNYFDDRALFMFSDGMRKRVEGCINLYRPGLLTTDGGTPPSPVTDAYLVDLSPRGSRERRSFFVNNTPFQAVVRNNGTSILTTVTLNVSMDAAAPVSTVFPLNLPVGSDTTLSLAPIAGSAGNHTLVIYTSSPNGVSDGYLNNDTLNSYINIVGANASLPFSEDFSSTTFPPTGWQIWNPNGGASNTWTRDGISGATNAGCAFFDNFSINQVGTLDELITPAIDPETNTNIELDFKVAYAAWDSIDVSSWDGLEVYVSGDGGKTYNLVYKKTGNQLATAPVTTDSFSARTSEPGKWREETIVLSPYVVAGQKLIIKFRNTNANGNNLYLDDINIAAICPTCTRDIQVLSIDNPRGFECTANINPSATIKNKGVETITGFSVAYQIDSGAVQTTTITGVDLPKDATMSVNLPASFNLSIGQHSITVYSFNPVSSVGTGDLVTSNDTLRKGFGIVGTTAAPLSEGFESTTFPPAGWVVVNPDGNITWQRAAAGNNSGGSAFMNNYNYGFTGRVDDLVTPIVKYSGVDSVSLSFDVAAGYTIGSPTDTLEVLATKDCGNSFTSLYKKWGTTLQTTSGPQSNPFYPSSPSQWRTETIDLTTIAPTGPAQIIFRNTNNNKNNIFIDNVNLKTRILPSRLKREGLLILPNPFVSQFTVWHYLPPTDLKAIMVYSSIGQLVWSKQFEGNAQKQEVVDLSARSSGIYIVKLVYIDSNHNTAVKIIKY